MQIITQERLKELLSYDPETGVFRWVSRPSNRIRVGDVAGNLDKKGYVRIRLDGVLYHAHRLAVFYVTGEWPENVVDHANRIRDDNRLENLRPCSNAQNQQNMGLPSHNTSGFKGVTFHKQAGKWMAQINFNGKHFGLGLHATPQAAALAYDIASMKLHGEFGRTNGAA